MRRLAAAWLVVAIGQGCAQPQSDDELELGERFVSERAFRRQVLEQSLAVRDNDYARERLDNYALLDGWEQLPEWNPLVAPIGEQEGAFEVVMQDELAFTRNELLALGQRAFERWPAQRIPNTPAADAEHALVKVRYRDGSEQLALTCATCHARVGADGGLVHGAASDVDLAALMGQPRWGPGLVDVTADARDNPVSIPDLRATRYQRRLHWTGNLNGGLMSIAVRIETLLITSASAAVRPPREVAFALALYVWSLGEDQRPVGTDTAGGAALFAQRCVRCHAGATGAGDLAPVALVGTDPGAAESSDRGSPGYRVPSLFRVAERTRLTHEGRFATLDALFDPQRREHDSAHPFGLDLDADDRQALLAFLRRQ